MSLCLEKGQYVLYLLKASQRIKFLCRPDNQLYWVWQQTQDPSAKRRLWGSLWGGQRLRWNSDSARVMQRVCEFIHCVLKKENSVFTNVIFTVSLSQQTRCSKMLQSSLWSSCAALIDPQPYIQACVQDMCGCSTANDFCVCSTLSEFSRQCSHAGGEPPNWRTVEFCGNCHLFLNCIVDFVQRC